jgi:hypothetical protein
MILESRPGPKLLACRDVDAENRLRLFDAPLQISRAVLRLDADCGPNMTPWTMGSASSRKPSQKFQKSTKSVLTVAKGHDYIRPTTRAAPPLAVTMFALVNLIESRVSDTLTALKPRAKRASILR